MKTQTHAPTSSVRLFSCNNGLIVQLGKGRFKVILRVNKHLHLNFPIADP